MASFSGTTKEMKKLFKYVRDQGWDVERRRNGHWAITGPEGDKVFCSGTPSDHRAIQNIKKDLSKAGLDTEQL